MWVELGKIHTFLTILHLALLCLQSFQRYHSKEDLEKTIAKPGKSQMVYECIMMLFGSRKKYCSYWQPRWTSTLLWKWPRCILTGAARRGDLSLFSLPHCFFLPETANVLMAPHLGKQQLPEIVPCQANSTGVGLGKLKHLFPICHSPSLNQAPGTWTFSSQHRIDKAYLFRFCCGRPGKDAGIMCHIVRPWFIKYSLPFRKKSGLRGIFVSFTHL